MNFIENLSVLQLILRIFNYIYLVDYQLSTKYFKLKSFKFELRNKFGKQLIFNSKGIL